MADADEATEKTEALPAADEAAPEPTKQDVDVQDPHAQRRHRLDTRSVVTTVVAIALLAGAFGAGYAVGDHHDGHGDGPRRMMRFDGRGGGPEMGGRFSGPGGDMRGGFDRRGFDGPGDSAPVPSAPSTPATPAAPAQGGGASSAPAAKPKS